ncbi:hypothetical protein QJS04_geneDACA011948 [Acorus gramineus]|uniref:Uncharacterized protein n=1 Tax=Acorus gramineus TaxID=55184 RepID=A0AAV9AJD8_ACOGR|nr:hypothetical protein QJS04_geneDACA011948 [Acorus gramineus]
MPKYREMFNLSIYKRHRSPKDFLPLLAVKAPQIQFQTVSSKEKGIEGKRVSCIDRSGQLRGIQSAVKKNVILTVYATESSEGEGAIPRPRSELVNFLRLLILKEAYLHHFRNSHQIHHSLIRMYTIRVERTVQKVSDEESGSYFHSRHRGSQIGAISKQSIIIRGRHVLHRQ